MLEPHGLPIPPELPVCRARKQPRRREIARAEGNPKIRRAQLRLNCAFDALTKKRMKLRTVIIEARKNVIQTRRRALSASIRIRRTVTDDDSV